MKAVWIKKKKKIKAQVDANNPTTGYLTVTLKSKNTADSSQQTHWQIQSHPGSD